VSTAAAPGAISKPVVFISHAATDEPIAAIIKAEIDRVFARGVKVFASSIPGTVQPGADWLRSIRENLDAAAAVVVLITPVSINRPWIWFEVGASWSRMEFEQGRIYPLCAPEVDLGDLPEPLGRLQALSLGKAEHIKLLFSALTEQFGFGNMKGFKGSTIKSRLPKYRELKVSEADVASGTLYRGPYEGYSPEELREVIDDELVGKAWQNLNSYAALYDGPRSSLFNGKLIHYREIDQRLHLPHGTARALLNEVVTSRYAASVAQQWENSVRFELEGEE
jgi:TIR domain